jgi:hypothetical protein
MALPPDESNFLQRWSRRKVALREGQALPEPGPVPVPLTVPVPALVLPAQATPEATPPPAEAPAPPAPTLADVAELTTTSDYTRFMARGVQPDVKNAALKKLFTDPHFNVMDGLDTYIDDYGKPDPLPPGMLRQMIQSQTLGLFDHEDEEERQRALSAPLPPNAEPDENTDLQLQPDDDTGRPGPAPGADEDAGRQH